MPTEERRILSDQEKQQLLAEHTVCYICQNPLDGYESDEIQFDHIYSYAEGFPQDLTNFAPVHASDDPNKANCHRAKGRKRPVDYREELRVLRELDGVTSLKDLRPDAMPSTYEISSNSREITINGRTIPLYNQKINGRDHLYFFDEVPTKFLEHDDQIQLRPLEPKIVPLIFNLKRSVQLLPSIGRLDSVDRKIKIFDGQHKAVAQIIGNNRDAIACIVFVEPDTAKLREVIYEAHTDFVQQRYKKSHMDAKLADIFAQRIADFRDRVGDPEAPYSETDILAAESAARQRQFILSGIIDELRAERDFVRLYVAQDKNEQKSKPMLWQSLERLVTTFCEVKPVDKPSDDALNFRSEEIENLCFLIDQIEQNAIRDKWSPENTADLNHVLCRTYFYRTAFNNWIKILERSIHFALEQMSNQAIRHPICYRRPYTTAEKDRLMHIISRCFNAPMWVKETNQNAIAGANKDSIVQELFDQEGFHYIYLAELGTSS